MLEKEYDYYLKNIDSLKDKYLNKFIVIKDDEVIGVYDDRTDALKKTAKKHKLGTFLIQQIVKDETKLFRKFYSRVYV